METGLLVLEKIGGKTTVTRCFSKYPLKFIIPNKVGSSRNDAAWIYTLTYGGGIVSVYKSIGSKFSEQFLEAGVGSNALLVVIPDPVTCFSTARYSQKQVFRVLFDSNLVVVDWFTSGRYEIGEKWDFGLYKSTNNILLEGGQPIFLDTVLLGQGSICSIGERMQDYQVIAMLILLGPNLKHMRDEIHENVKNMMSEELQITSTASGHCSREKSGFCMTKPNLIASCSTFGPKGGGLIVRVAAMRTESVYQFLRLQLARLEPILGASPYH